jgi:hypothetical protein
MLAMSFLMATNLTVFTGSCKLGATRPTLFVENRATAQDEDRAWRGESSLFAVQWREET